MISGTIDNPKNEGLADLNVRELATFVPLIILAVWIGLYPSPFLRRLETSVERVMTRVNADYAPQNVMAVCQDDPSHGEERLAKESKRVDGAGAEPCLDDKLTSEPINGSMLSGGALAGGN